MSIGYAMTQFEEWWSRQDQTLDKVLAERAWNTAQVALIRTISEPPYIPKSGEKIRFRGLCHPKSMGEIKEVTEVYQDTLKVYWVGTKTLDGEKYSSGILSEVEPVCTCDEGHICDGNRGHNAQGCPSSCPIHGKTNA